MVKVYLAIPRIVISKRSVKVDIVIAKKILIRCVKIVEHGLTTFIIDKGQNSKGLAITTAENMDSVLVVR